MNPGHPAAAFVCRRLLALALMLAVLPAGAGSLSITPLRLDFGAQRNIAHLTLTNTTQETLTVETEAQSWPLDADGQSARDLSINPPVATLRPGARLVVRVGLLRRLSDERERAYRLYITELPAPRGEGAQGIGVRLRVGIPLFVAAREPQAKALEWSSEPEGDDLILLAHNPGNVHQRLQQLQVSAPGGTAVPAQGLPYVMPGQTARFRAPGFGTAKTLRLDLRTDQSGGAVELLAR